MRIKSPTTRGWSLRYYLVFDHSRPVLRLPSTMHRKLLSGELSIAQLANTRVMLLEVFISLAKKGKILDTRGSVYSFGPDGRVDLTPSVEAVSLEIDRAVSRSTKVVDLSPSLRSRRWKTDRTWTPKASLLEQVRMDLSATRAARRLRSAAELLKSS